MNIRTRRVAVYGLLIALAFVFGYIERLLPIYLGAPGQYGSVLPGSFFPALPLGECPPFCSAWPEQP